MNQILKSMSLNAVAKDLMLTYTIEHHYENTTGDPVEISYSFPLKSTAVITEFEATVGGVTRRAKAFPKVEAKEKYEESLDKGDAPVMLEVFGGIASTSLGNLKPQEKATVRLTIAEVLEVKQGTVKITIPTVIADRYEMDWGAAPRNEKRVRSNLFAHYDCKGKIVLSGFLAKGRVSSPTHKISLASIGGGDFEVLLPENAALNRDITIDISDVAGEGMLVSPDNEGWAAVASFSPKAEVADKPIALSILVDCSGSMYGTSIELTKKALRRFSQSLKRRDTITYSRFGSEVVHDIQEPMKCTVRNMRDVFLPCVRETDADMGGTELVGALKAVIDPKGAGAAKRDILLITDGAVWGEESLFAVVKNCSCRLFIIGIGLAPEEANLSHCAKATRGAYEAVHDESEIAKAIARMLVRMRAQESVAPAIDWGRVKPDYQSKLPLSIFSGDSVTVYAHFSEKPDVNPVLTWFHNTDLMRTDLHDTKTEDVESVVKLVAYSRMIEAEDTKTQEKIGCEYDLVGPATNLLLTIERTEGEAVEGIPELVVVPQMIVEDSMSCSGVLYSPMLFAEERIMRFCEDFVGGRDSDEKAVELIYTFLLTGKGYRDIFEESELIEIFKDNFTQLKDLDEEAFLKELAKILYEILLGDSGKEARAIRKALRAAGFQKGAL